MPIEDFTLEWAQETIDKLLYPDKFEAPEPDKHCFDDKIEDFLKFKKISIQRHKSYHIIFDIVKRFELYTGKPINLDEATGDTLVALAKFFKDEHTFFEPKKDKYRTILVPNKKYKHVWDNSNHEKVPQQRSDNAIVTYMSAVRAYWLWCIDMGSNKELAAVWDIFVFQCYIGCRISDLMTFGPDNIVETPKGIALNYVPSKTKEENPRTVRVYLSPTAIEILHSYMSPEKKTIFPYYNTAKINDLVKLALKKAGVTRVVTIMNPVTKMSEQHPICDVASSHMARRTFIGNLYKKVKDPNLVGKLSGHCEGSKAFARYRDIDDDMIREMTNLLD